MIPRYKINIKVAFLNIKGYNNCTLNFYHIMIEGGNMLDKKAFFEKYKIEKEFEQSGLSWDTLSDIYDDYEDRMEEVKKVSVDFERYIKDNIQVPIHSVRCREKDSKHLIEKIIRKRGSEQNKKYADINVSNYREIIRDLIGARILILAKEEWKDAFDNILEMFASSREEDSMHFIAEPPIAYTRYGDRNIFADKINVEHTNKGYRSQHYIVGFKNYYCEIQVRTLTEEVYGEFDHKVKYPYRENNNFLRRYTTTLSQLLGSVDELISTCVQMEEKGWDECNKYYEDDKYIDWSNISKPTNSHSHNLKSEDYIRKNGKINVEDYLKQIILRKDL